MSDADDGPRAPLSVAADLSLSVNGTPVEVTSTGERLFVTVDTAADAVRAFHALPDDGVDSVVDLLRTTDLTVEVRVRDRTVAVVGSAAHPGVLSQTLGVDPVEVRLGGVLGVVGREVAAALSALERTLR